uniref:MAM domain-containing glycosylphosphatidylinositol anchor protein 1 n=1 Tax=Magallana gigas TaxID=29159 RepID=K1PIW9_MAGGI
MIGTYPGSSKQGLFGVCAPRCNNDIRCNAIDICFENLKCKLISGITPLTPGNVFEGVCKRFQMECDAAKTYCLTMYYHMYGDTINTLTIRTQRGSNAAIDRWKLSGDQGNVWHYLSGVNLPLDSQTKIIIEATKGSSFTGDTAIDYVELWPFACP